MAISQEDVFTAADSLEASGTNPSVLTVRAHLGNTGSSTTILKHLREWKESKSSATGVISANGPSDIEQDIRKLVAKAHRQGYEQGKYDARLAEESIREELARTVFIRDEATAEMERMESSMLSLQEDRDGLINQLSQANQDLAVARDAIDQQTKEITNLEHTHSSQGKRIEELNALLVRAEAESVAAKAEGQRLYDLLMRGTVHNKENEAPESHGRKADHSRAK